MTETNELMALRIRVRRTGVVLMMLGLVALPVVLLFLIFGLPVLGNYVVLSMAQDHGCHVSADGPHPCIMYGVDMGGTVYNYAIWSLLGGFGNPVILLGVIRKFVPFWVMFYGTQLWFIAAVAATVLRCDALKRLRLADGHSRQAASGR